VAFFTPYELAKVYCEKNEGKGDVDMETAKLIWNAMRKYEGFIPLYTPKRKIAPSFSHGAACYGFYHDLFRPDDKEASHNIRLKAGMLPPLKKRMLTCQYPLPLFFFPPLSPFLVLSPTTSYDLSLY
jgi:hypothetical protein